MKRLTLAASLTLAVAVPGVASAQLSHRQYVAYGKAYGHVVHVFGYKTAGCKLIGPHTTCTGAATDARILKSTGVLQRMFAPRPVVHYSTTPTTTTGYHSYSYSGGGGAGGILAHIRACESGGNYSTNTGNGFYGAYQFTQGTWNAMGGSGNPADASPAEQDALAAKLYAGGAGAGNWPVCSH